MGRGVTATVDPATVAALAVGPASIKPDGYSGPAVGINLVRRAGGPETRAPAWVTSWRPTRPLGHCRSSIHLTGVFDESGSVTSSHDPIAYRHALFARALREAARTCTCRRCSVGLVSFDVSASAGPVSLNRRTAKTLAEVMDGFAPTSSLLSSALAWAEDKAAGTGIATPVTVVISDYEIFDPPIERVYERLGAMPGLTLAVVLSSEPPEELAEQRIRTEYIGSDADRTAVADAVAAAISHARAGGSW